MSNTYGELIPKPVFRYFEEISKIPRGSGNEKAISDYLVKFGKDRGLEVTQDAALNVIIKKHGTQGYENSPTVIIQGHMDMVCEKNKTKIHDFLKDPIELRVEGDMLYASDTTLGADDGIAVAYALALLDSKDTAHPPLEVLITTEEEVGLVGASALDAGCLKGRLLINLDAEDEGELTAGCAGGIRVRETLPIVWESVGKNLVPYKISITGLMGGHSGGEIHRGRGNSNKLMGRILHMLSLDMEYSINEINGGLKMNAIPREADAVILINPSDSEKFEKIVNEYYKVFKNELRVSDPGLLIKVEKLNGCIGKAFSKETARKAVASLILTPSGVQTMSMDIEGLVESSTNLGVVTTAESHVTFESAVRSSIRSLKYNIVNQVKVICDVCGAEFSSNADYPEWEYNPSSALRDMCNRIYNEKYGKDLKIKVVHGGIECGLFKEKMPDADMVSFGPDMCDIHTPNEHISISSILRTWDYLLAILKELK